MLVKTLNRQAVILAHQLSFLFWSPSQWLELWHS